jgi:hypothetical protein
MNLSRSSVLGVTATHARSTLHIDARVHACYSMSVPPSTPISSGPGRKN